MFPFFLADDLSGALDAGAAFHRAGAAVRVFVTPGAWRGDEAGVAAITTETRTAAPARAEATVAQVLEHARARGAQLWYKKIDSTLRGPIAAELRAVRTVFPDLRILFAPANPAVGRTVENGILRVRGVPVAETEFSRDPLNPLQTSVVAEILGAIITDDFVIPDVTSDADFARAVGGMNRDDRPWIGVGSGALVRHVIAARTLPATTVAETAPPAVGSARRGGGVLMIAGSAHPVNRGQVEALQHARGGDVIQIDPANPTGIATHVAASLDRDRLVVLQLAAARIDPVAALRALTRGVLAVFATTTVERVFATGGETAFALCESLGVAALQFREELEPGVALAAASWERGEMLLGVKPGGFGDTDTWIRAYDRLRA